MNSARCLFTLLAPLVLLAGLGLVAAQQGPTGLTWDATSKSYSAKPGETNVLFVFALTNTSPSEITINTVRTSCGCTVAKLPTLPWRLAPAAHGEIEVAVDLRGKQGILTKTISVDTTAGFSLLVVSVNIPAPSERERNQMLALADRQAVFRNDCASCHAAPAAGKKGMALFEAACAICHESEHRASMVPDLKVVGKTTPPEYWRLWITTGKPGSLMPAFSKDQGGPLDEEQIRSLVDYLSNHYPPAEKLRSNTTPLETDLTGLPPLPTSGP